jgi:rSAM/selenodomain-associated transferase 1
MPRYADAHPPQRAACALVVFAKAPIPGTVKTRLTPPLTALQAARFHAALVEDTLRRVRSLDMARYLACAPGTRQPFFQTCASRYRVSLIAQGSGDLGARMQRVVARLLARHPVVVVVGTDSPTLPVEYIREAERRLKTEDVVFGPSEDGGYYLVGQRRLHRAIFRGVTWGGATVLAETRANLGPSLRVGLLPRWYDVDRFEDLTRLQTDLDASNECPRTRAWFRAWRPRSARSRFCATL